MDEDQGRLRRGSEQRERSRFASWFLLPGSVWLLALFVAPLGIVVALSFGTTDDFGAARYGWHPSNYADVVDPVLLPVLARSLGYAATTVVLCALIGYPVAYTIARYGGRWRHLLLALLVLPFFVNQLVRTYAWVALLSDEGVLNGLLPGDPVQLINTPWAVIGGLVYAYMAFMVLPVYVALERMDPALIEAGKDLYGTPWQTFRHVTLPATSQGLLAGSVLVFLPAVGDFVNARLLGGSSTYMVGSLIQQQFLQAENWPFGAALTVVLMALLLVGSTVYLRAAAREPGTAA